MSSEKNTNFGKIRIGQFAPSEEHPKYQGVYGWGFDTHGFRFVVYGPHHQDSWLIASKEREIARKRHEREQELMEGDDAERARLRAEKRAAKRARRQRTHRQEEHGPAHVHVYHIQSGRESKFELFERYDGTGSVEILANGNGNGNGNGSRHTTPLTPREIRAVTPILEAVSLDMIQLWRELHIDSKLSGYVSRIDDMEGHEVISRVQPGGWMEITNGDGRIIREPPPRMPSAEGSHTGRHRNRRPPSEPERH